MKTQDNTRLLPRDKPNVSRMFEDLEADMDSCGHFIQRLQAADATREAWWENQSDDGRKHDTTEYEVTPYDGAPDMRVRTAEEIVNERVLMQQAAMIGGRVQFTPKESGDATDSALFATLMRHFVEGEMLAEIRDETDFLLEWKEGGSLSLLHIGWHTERALELRTISEKDLLTFAVNAGLAVAGLPTQEEMQQSMEDGTADPAQASMVALVSEITEDDLRAQILDPSQTKNLIRQIREFDPDITAAEALRVARALQAGEEGEYHAPYVKESRPFWEALQPGVDVIFSGASRRLQSLPRITRRHWMQRADVIDRANTEKWDKDWLNLVLANPGRATQLGTGSGSWVMSGSATRYEFMSDDELVRAGYYEIIEMYSRVSSQAGAPALYRTILHGAVNNAYGLHALCPYKHGKYPFIEFRRERKKRPITSGRSIPEMAATNQQSIKDLLDARRSRVELAISPPIITTGRRTGGRIRIGPDMEIPEARTGTLRWMDPPRMDVDTVAVLQDERAMLNRFWGRWDKDVPQPIVQLHQQKLVNDFLLDLSQAMRMTGQLIQQYVTPEEASRIVGTEYSLDATRRAIQAQWDVTTTFDVRDLDLDWLAKKMKLTNEFVLAGDVMNVVNKAGMTEYMFSALDPVMARQLIVPQEHAAQNEINDEDRALSIIFTGGEPELQQGQNHAARAQRMQEATFNSDTRRQALQTNGQIAAVWENRLKFHQTQIAQKKNKQIGRLGGSPVLGEALSEADKIPGIES